MQRQELRVFAPGDVAACGDGLANFGSSGQKHKHVASSLRDGGIDRGCNLLFERAGRMRRVLKRHGKYIARRADHWSAVQLCREILAAQCGRHEDQAQVTPPQEGERKVGFKMTFMELVKHDDLRLVQAVAPEEPSREHAFRAIPEPCARSARLLEADLVSDGLAERLTSFLGNTARCHTGCQSARFQHEYLGEAGVEQGSGNARGLARPRFRFDQQDLICAHCIDDAGQKGIDRERRECGHWSLVRRLSSRPQDTIERFMHALRLTCEPGEVDGISAQLWEAGTAGIQEIERGALVELIAGFEDARRGTELLERFQAYRPEWERQPETDWVAVTHAAWPPREIGTRIFLVPLWFNGSTPRGRVRIIHNPGRASGTGEHPCTQLVLEALERIVKRDMTVLDVGTGSGILAIAAVRLGATVVCGVDTDAEALETARENFELNGVAPNLVAGTAECLLSETGDVVAANINPTVLLSILDDLFRITKPGGHLILSGFVAEETSALVDLLPRSEVSGRGPWRCIVAAL